MINKTRFLSLAAGLALSGATPPPADYDFAAEDALSRQIDFSRPDPAQLNGIFAKRRSRVLRAIPEGAMLIYSVEWTQPSKVLRQTRHSVHRQAGHLIPLRDRSIFMRWTSI